MLTPVGGGGGGAERKDGLGEEEELELVTERQVGGLGFLLWLRFWVQVGHCAGLQD